MRFLVITRKLTKALVVVWLLCHTLDVVHGQTRADLETAQKQLQQKINLTSKLLSNVSKEKATSMTGLALLSDQIAARRKLLRTLERKQVHVKGERAEKVGEIKALRKRSERLAASYASILQTSYRSSMLKNRWLFILSSMSFNQMYMRWRYLKQVNTAWKTQLEEMLEAKRILQEKIVVLEDLEKEQRSVIALQRDEQSSLQKSLDVKKSLVKSLSKKERDLKQELAAHAKARAKLRSAIEKVIRESSGGLASESNLPLTPAMAKLAASFAASKGSLPWPVQKGIVSKGYGKQPHPALKQVTIVNNGIDIQTEKDASVRALYKGRVVGHQYIPGYDHMIIVAHGDYYTVYSYLAEVDVHKGDVLETGQHLGRARNHSGIGEVHLEIWKGRELQDPDSWLMGIL